MTVYMKGDTVACPHCLQPQESNMPVEKFIPEGHPVDVPYLCYEGCMHCEEVLWVTRLSQLEGAYRVAKTRNPPYEGGN